MQPPPRIVVIREFNRDGAQYYHLYVYENNYLKDTEGRALTRINPRHRMVACMDGKMILASGGKD